MLGEHDSWTTFDVLNRYLNVCASLKLNSNRPEFWLSILVPTLKTTDDTVNAWRIHPINPTLVNSAPPPNSTLYLSVPSHFPCPLHLYSTLVLGSCQSTFCHPGFILCRMSANAAVYASLFIDYFVYIVFEIHLYVTLINSILYLIEKLYFTFWISWVWDFSNWWAFGLFLTLLWILKTIRSVEICFHFSC